MNHEPHKSRLDVYADVILTLQKSDGCSSTKNEMIRRPTLKWQINIKRNITRVHSSLKHWPYSRNTPTSNNKVDYKTRRSNADSFLRDTQHSDLYKWWRIPESLYYLMLRLGSTCSLTQCRVMGNSLSVVQQQLLPLCMSQFRLQLCVFSPRSGSDLPVALYCVASVHVFYAYYKFLRCPSLMRFIKPTWILATSGSQIIRDLSQSVSGILVTYAHI